MNNVVESHLDGRSVLVQSVAYLGDNWSVRPSGCGAVWMNNTLVSPNNIRMSCLLIYFYFTVNAPLMTHLFWADLLKNSAFSPICKKKRIVKSYQPVRHCHPQINSDMVKMSWLPSCLQDDLTERQTSPSLGRSVCTWTMCWLVPE